MVRPPSDPGFAVVRSFSAALSQICRKVTTGTLEWSIRLLTQALALVVRGFSAALSQICSKNVTTGTARTEHPPSAAGCAVACPVIDL